MTNKNYKTIKELSKKYGLPISFFHKLTFRREIEFVKAGNSERSKVLIDENVFIEYLEQNRFESKEQIEERAAISA